jgi:alkylhydroperoxidase family enzyme
MSRVPPLDYDAAPPRSRAEWDRQAAAHGRMTNMKRTLAHSPEALEAYMRWYPLRDEVEAFLGKRLTLLFVHAISMETDCLICSTYFRRDLIEAGEDPDRLVLSEKELAFVRFGRQIAQDPHGVTDALAAAVGKHMDPAQLVSVTALAGLMIATNLFNDVLEVQLDGYLEPYRAGGTR